MLTASIVIPTVNRWHCLPDTIRSLSRAIEQDLEIVVVDQTADARPDAQEYLQQLIPQARLSYCKLDQSSLPRALNAGFYESRGDIIIYIDDDVLVSPGFVESHVGYYDDDAVWAVAGHSVDIHGNPYFQPPPGSPPFLRQLVGANMSFRRSTLEKLHGFDARLFKNTDLEISRRILHAGGRIANGSRSLLTHIGDAVGGCGNRGKSEGWYFRTYHDQTCILFREGLVSAIFRAPRTIWAVLRYFSPGWKGLLNPWLWRRSLLPGIVAGVRSAWLPGPGVGNNHAGTSYVPKSSTPTI